jgi:hypothetical protein
VLECYADVIAIRHFQQGARRSCPLVQCPHYQLWGWLGRTPDSGALNLYTTLQERAPLMA